MQTITKLVELPILDFNLTALADTHLSQIYFEEFINGSDCPVLLIGDYFLIVGDTDKPYFKKSHLFKMKKRELEELAAILCSFYYDATKQELIYELEGITIADYYKAVAQGWHSAKDYDFIIRGHSQGDAVKVLLLEDAPKHITEDYLTNLFYDCPSYIRLDITNNLTEEERELYLDELLSNTYHYDKEEIIDNISQYDDLDYKEEILEYLKSNLPDYLEVR